jgi:hypothetical protein
MRKTETKIRQAIAELAARYIAEDGLITYHAAKRKAADHLGYYNNKELPKNIEIERAVINYQNLYQSSFQPQALSKLRGLAIEIMNQFEHFSPRLVGSVLTGTAGNHSEIIIHLFSDNPDAISIQLQEVNIPYEMSEKKIRTTDKNSMPFPSCSFFAGGAPVVLIVFPEKCLRQAPLCPIDEKPIQRANIKKVQSLLTFLTEG